MGARSFLPWSCFTKLQGKNTSFLSNDGLHVLACLFGRVHLAIVVLLVFLCYPICIFFLFRTRYGRHFMAIWCMNFMSFFNSFEGVLRCSSAWVDHSWTTLLTHLVIVVRVLIFHLVALCFYECFYEWVIFLLAAAMARNLSWQ